MSATSGELRALARRLRGIDHPEAQAVADDLERAARGPGRPPLTTEKQLRRLLAESLFHGEAAPLLGAEVADSDVARAARGNRTEADALAAELLESSDRSVRRARSWSLHGASVEEIAALAGLLRAIGEAEEEDRQKPPE